MAEEKKIYQLSLKKGEDLYIFRYEEGTNIKVLDAITRTASDPRTNFDWFDAAVLTHQLGRNHAKELKKYLEK
ncbi:MAG TPA: hypothetical protein VJK51_02140 [Candidatus Nanoarchaeia archaeon]|nr:hypothetical protein [Candidatus Nanoarchaeia archaeon]